MDPDTCLNELRALVAQVQHRMDQDDVPDDLWVLAELVERFQGLDQWLTNGGFLPKPWTRPS